MTESEQGGSKLFRDFPVSIPAIENLMNTMIIFADKIAENKDSPLSNPLQMNAGQIYA